MNKLNKSEADRVVSVLDASVHLADKLKYLPFGAVEPAVLDRVGGRTARLLDAQAKLEGRFSDAVVYAGASASEDDEVELLGAEVRKSTRALCRALAEDPESASVLETCVEPSVTLRSFTDWVQSWKETTEHRLAMTVEQELERKEMLLQLTQKIYNSEQAQSLLEEKLRAEKLARETHVAELTDTASKLKTELEDLSARAERDRLALIADTARREDVASEAHDESMQALQAQLAALKAEDSKKTDQYSAAEQNIRKRRNMMQSEVAAKVKEYDTAMMTEQEKIDELTALHEEEKSRLQVLVDHFTLVDKNDELAAKEAADEAARLDEKRKVYEFTYGQPASIIQRAWQRRQKLKAEALAKKGKKKKGKKGKKGKKARR